MTRKSDVKLRSDCAQTPLIQWESDIHWNSIKVEFDDGHRQSEFARYTEILAISVFDLLNSLDLTNLIRTSELSENRNNKDLEGPVVRIKWVLPNKFNETCGAKVQIYPIVRISWACKLSEHSL